MKQFQEYITEQEDKDLLNLINSIKRECKPYLTMIKKCNVWTKGSVGVNCLHRGIKGFKAGWSKRKVRQDRQPRDNNPKMTEYIDNAFMNKFGWRPRTQGLFAMNMPGSPVQFYGTPTVIFPVSNFKYLWSARHSDLIYQGYDEFFYQEDADEIAEHYTDTGFCQYLFNTAGKSGREIMIKCLYYYAVRYDYLYKKYKPESLGRQSYFDKFFDDLI